MEQHLEFTIPGWDMAQLKNAMPELNLPNLVSYLISTNQAEQLKYLYKVFTIEPQMLINGFYFDAAAYQNSLNQYHSNARTQPFSGEAINNSKIYVNEIFPNSIMQNLYLWAYFPFDSLPKSQSYCEKSFEYHEWKRRLNLASHHNVINFSNIQINLLRYWNDLLYKSLTPLGLAILDNKNDILKFLLEETKSQVENPAFYFLNEFSLTPLQLAILVRNYEAVAQLINHGADINKTMDIKCINQEVKAGKFTFCLPTLDRPAKTSDKVGNQIIYKEEWIMQISPLALTLLIKYPQNPQDKNKAEEIATLLCRKGANYNQKLKTIRANNDNNRVMRLDEIDQYNILGQIKAKLKAEKHSLNNSQPQKFFKDNFASSQNNIENSQSRIEQLEEKVKFLEQTVSQLQNQVNTLQSHLQGNYSIPRNY